MSDATQHEHDDELLSAYLDDELSADQRAAVEARLAADPAARQMVDELRHVSDSVRDLPAESLGRDLREAIVRKAEAAKRSADPPADSAASPPTFTIGRTKRGWLWASLAIAAALLIMFTQEDAGRDRELKDLAAARQPAIDSAAPESSAVVDETDRLAVATRRPADADLEGSHDAVETDTRTTIRREMAEGLAASSSLEAGAEEIAAPSDESEPLVVHVLAKRAALENKLFEKLLVSNGIAIEPESAPDGSGVAREADRATGLSIAERAGGETGDVEVVLVDAPRPKIVSLVSDLNQDYANYSGLAVDDATPQSSAPQATDVPALNAPVSEEANIDLSRYSRGTVPQQQKENFARNKQFYYERTPAAPYGTSGGGAIGSYSAPSASRSSKADKEYANEGRAQRLVAPQAELQATAELRKLAQDRAAAPRSENNLQVLFVIAPEDAAAAASPAAENRAE